MFATLSSVLVGTLVSIEYVVNIIKSDGRDSNLSNREKEKSSSRGDRANPSPRVDRSQSAVTKDRRADRADRVESTKISRPEKNSEPCKILLHIYVQIFTVSVQQNL